MWTKFDAGSIGMAISTTIHIADCLLSHQQQRQHQRFHLFERKCELNSTQKISAPNFIDFFFSFVSGKLKYHNRRRNIEAARVREPAIGGRVSVCRLVWYGRIGFRSSKTLAGRHQFEWGSCWHRWFDIDVDGGKSAHSAATSVALESVARQQYIDSLWRSCVKSGASVEFLQVTLPHAPMNAIQFN